MCLFLFELGFLTQRDQKFLICQDDVKQKVIRKTHDLIQNLSIHVKKGNTDKDAQKEMVNILRQLHIFETNLAYITSRHKINNDPDPAISPKKIPVQQQPPPRPPPPPPRPPPPEFPLGGWIPNQPPVNRWHQRVAQPPVNRWQQVVYHQAFPGMRRGLRGRLDENKEEDTTDLKHKDENEEQHHEDKESSATTLRALLTQLQEL